MNALILTLMLMVFSIVSARALTTSNVRVVASDVQVVGRDHNWTIHLWRRYYGVSGNNAVAIPGLRIPLPLP